jgi:DNA-binding transcriptional ArsR family regulator
MRQLDTYTKSPTESLIKVVLLSQNNDYYINVFKKTEQTISVIFYVLSYAEESRRSAVLVESLVTRTQLLYETVLASLSWPEPGVEERLLSLQQALRAVDGTLRIVTAARVLSPVVVAPIEAELDLIMRYIRNHYLLASPTPFSPTVNATPRPRPRTTPPRQNRPVIPAGDISSDAHLVYAALTDRASRIKTVLEAKPEATIKDISEIITDVSEKTIQRELNSLIEKGQVVRQGERRWSKYSLRV